MVTNTKIEGEVRVKYKGNSCTATVKVSKNESKLLAKALRESMINVNMLAKAYGTSESIIYNWIGGKRSVGITKLIAIYDVTGRPQSLSFVEKYIEHCERQGFKLELETGDGMCGRSIIGSLRSDIDIAYAMASNTLREVYRQSPQDRRDGIIKSIEDLTIRNIRKNDCSSVVD